MSDTRLGCAALSGSMKITRSPRWLRNDWPGSCRKRRISSRRASDGRTSVRGAFGVFYDALAGQGDFFQNGVLAPPFTPLVEVNSPPASITLANFMFCADKYRRMTAWAFGDAVPANDPRDLFQTTAWLHTLPCEGITVESRVPSSDMRRTDIFADVEVPHVVG